MEIYKEERRINSLEYSIDELKIKFIENYSFLEERNFSDNFKTEDFKVKVDEFEIPGIAILHKQEQTTTSFNKSQK